MALNRKKTPELLALEEEMARVQRQIAAEEANQRAEEARLRAVAKKAGPNYAALINDLYERLGIEPEHPMIRNSKTGPIEVAADKSEELRVQRLDTFLTAVLDTADADLIETLQLQDGETRDRHRDERTKDKKDDPTTELQLVDEAAADDLDGTDEGDTEEDSRLYP